MAREGKFTRGEWLCAGTGCQPGAYTVVGDGNQMVALVYGKTREEQLANAALIATAPALYEALRNLEQAAQAHLDTTDGSEREYLREECFKARAALQSAEPTP